MGILLGMDEILIGEKKYISSKAAAKATGYAKDYVGQMCREGRVPARLVGRSWYVLESALHDHRFGESKKSTSESLPVAEKVWDAPRYESTDVEVLPIDEKKIVHEQEDADMKIESEQTVDASDQVSSAWQEWFTHVESASEKKSPEVEVETPEPEDQIGVAPAEEDRATDDAVEVPLSTLYEPERQISAEDAIQQRHPKHVEKPTQHERMSLSRGSSKLFRTTQLASVFVASFLALSAILGSGYFDKYIISSSQFSLVAGVTVYK